ncbi:helix-turn-helix transcriptional regulator [Azospirillum sp. SYSU D00513]|uniref:helix-turn-helix domain-containing protein n=1 Tax=Azospirillum sp. SYSU D00513 TaxID=2812561 RepID=UPI001FFF0FE8|nr:helix-turn-helix transcriptional regulator [Azospirillum sp. SYSU D00513]
MARGKRVDSMEAGGEAQGPDAVDIHVGKRVRHRRTLMGITQTQLGQSVGLTFQQIQKYEKGANRVSASKLWEFGRALDVPVSFFFDDMPDGLRGRGGLAPDRADSAPADDREPDLMVKRETLELMKAYHRIADPLLRKRLHDTFEAIAKACSGTKAEKPDEQAIDPDAE